MRFRPITWVAGIALALGGLSLTTHATPQGPSSKGRCLSSAEGPRAPLGEGQKAAIVEALQDEYQGEAIYARVLKDHGEMRPFSNVVRAEQRHASFLENLLTARNLPVPENEWTAAPVPGYASRQEACAAAIDFEVTNVALYDRLLASGALPDDVRQAFEHNRMASLEHHKPAFERCSAGSGQGHGATASRGQGRGSCGGSSCGCRGRGGCSRGGGQGRGHGHGQGHGQGRGRCTSTDASADATD